MRRSRKVAAVSLEESWDYGIGKDSAASRPEAFKLTRHSGSRSDLGVDYVAGVFRCYIGDQLRDNHCPEGGANRNSFHRVMESCVQPLPMPPVEPTEQRAGIGQDSSVFICVAEPSTARQGAK